MTRRELIGRAARLGFECQLTAGHHLRFVHSSGAVVIAASTPGCDRSWANALSDMRRLAGTRLMSKPAARTAAPRKDRPSPLQRLRAAWASASAAERMAFMQHDLPQRAAR